MSKETQLLIFSKMIEIRRTEELLIKEYRPFEQMRCPIHFCVGQEASPAALTNLLRTKDVIYAHHRSHGYYLAKQGSLTSMIAEFYGKNIGVNSGLAGSQELSCPEINFYCGAILSGSFAMSTGSAFASNYLNNDCLTIAVIGDGGMEEGIVFETINLAAIKNLPILFICENNNYSSYTPLKERTLVKDLNLKVKEFGIETHKVSSNDVFEINELYEQSINKIINYKKPIFIEINTYRYSPHVGPEENSDYRSKKELEFWIKNDCIDIAKNKMIGSGYTNELINKIYQEIDKKINNSIEIAKKAKFPNYQEAIHSNLQNTYHEIVKKFVKDDLHTKYESGQKETKLNPY